MAASDLQDVPRIDRLDGWPLPDSQPAWFGDPAAETALLDAYRGGRMHHAWLVGGPKGIGKATLAYRFARFVLAHRDPQAPAVAAEVDAYDGFDALLLAPPHELAGTAGVVDVRQRQRGDAPSFRPLHQFFRRERSVTQAVVGVAVEEHGSV